MFNGQVFVKAIASWSMHPELSVVPVGALPSYASVAAATTKITLLSTV
jgi:hypothetical protein